MIKLITKMIFGCLLSLSAIADVTQGSLAVTVVKVTEEEYRAAEKLRGTVVAKNEIIISSALPDHVITQVLVEEGEWVKKGDLLAVLETPLQDQGVNRILAEIEKTQELIKQQEALYTHASTELKRMKLLTKKNVISLNELDKYKSEASSSFAALNAIKADKRQLEAQLASQKIQQAKTKLLAPIDGVISERIAKVGNLTDNSHLFKLIEQNKLEFEIDEYYTKVGSLKKGDSINVHLDENKNITGEVRFVSPKIDSITQLRKVRVSLVDTPNNIQVGSFGYAIYDSENKKIEVLPYSAIRYQSDNINYVYVVIDDLVHKVNVITGVIFDGKVQIISGVNKDDNIIATSSSFLNEADKVNVIN